jgi:hypothetical protein
MKKRKLIGLFLMLVFLVTMMPVVQVGAMLNQGQLTEERADQSSDSVSKFNETDTHTYLIGSSKSDVSSSLYIKRENDEHFLSRQADDIQTPPPNQAS